MINLYIFNETRKGAVYGVGTYITELTNALKNSNINLCVICLRSDKPEMQIEEKGSVKYWDIPFPSVESEMDYDQWINRYHRNIIYVLRLHIRDHNNLVFHLNFNNGQVLAESLKEVFICKVIAVVHHSDWALKLHGNLKRLHLLLAKPLEERDIIEQLIVSAFEKERGFFQVIDQTVALSQDMRHILCNDYSLDAAKVSVIPNGLSNKWLKPVENKSALRTKWRIKKDEKIILFAGRLDEIKGLSYLIKAFREVLQVAPECRLVIAGNGNFDIFMKEARDICLKINFTGFLEKTELYELYHIADVGVVPSLYEPFGYVALEMMMHSLPIVATATSGLNEVVDEPSALKIPVVEYDDKVEIDHLLLAENILYLVQHTGIAQNLGENARKRYEQNYTAEIMGRNMIELYTSLIET